MSSSGHGCKHCRNEYSNLDGRQCRWEPYRHYGHNGIPDVVREPIQKWLKDHSDQEKWDRAAYPCPYFVRDPAERRWDRLNPNLPPVKP